MSTAVEICNAALLMLGAREIASLTEATVQAKRCNAVYGITKRELLRDHPWNFAIRNIQLPAMAEAPLGGWSYQFTVPPDCLRLMQVGERGYAPDYELRAGRILCNASPLYIAYVSEAEEGAFDAKFVDLMVRGMAAKLAYAETASASLADAMATAFERAKRAAKSIDGVENPPEDWGVDSPFLSVRG